MSRTLPVATAGTARDRTATRRWPHSLPPPLPPLLAAVAAIVALVAVAVTAVVTTAASADAHSELVASAPQAGAVVGRQTDRLVLVFGEPVDAGTAQVVVLGPGDTDAVSGPPVVTGSTVEVPLHLVRAGAHRATYRVVSADGHPVVGAVRFAVRARPIRVAGAGSGDEGELATAAPARADGLLGGTALTSPEQTTAPEASGTLAFAGAAAAAVVLLPALTLVVGRRRRGRSERRAGG